MLVVQIRNFRTFCLRLHVLEMKNCLSKLLVVIHSVFSLEAYGMHGYQIFGLVKLDLQSGEDTSDQLNECCWKFSVYSESVLSSFIQKSIVERLDDGEIIVGDGGYTVALEKRNYIKVGTFTPECVVKHPDAGQYYICVIFCWVDTLLEYAQ